MSSPERTNATVLVVDDEWIVAQDIRRILQGEGYDVPPPVTSGAEVMAAVQKHQPDLVLFDIGLDQGRDGIAIARECQQVAGSAVLFVSGNSDVATLARAGELGPGGFVVKPFSDAQLRAAVRLALAMPARERADATLRAIRALLDGGSPAAPPASPLLALLSQREREVATLLADARRVPGIATALGISVATVRNHIKAIFAKAGVHSQEELITLLREGKRPVSDGLTR